jgi:hypothetical protein
LAELNFKEAVELAEQTGAKSNAAETLITALEELRGKLPHSQLREFYESAAHYVAYTDDPATLKRWTQSVERYKQGEKERTSAEDDGQPAQPANIILATETEIDWSGFSLGDLICNVEEHFIKSALRKAGGSVTKASALLGFGHHESLRSRLKKYPRLRDTGRTPMMKRRRSLIKND